MVPFHIALQRSIPSSSPLSHLGLSFLPLPAPMLASLPSYPSIHPVLAPPSFLLPRHIIPRSSLPDFLPNFPRPLFPYLPSSILCQTSLRSSSALPCPPSSHYLPYPSVTPLTFPPHPLPPSLSPDHPSQLSPSLPLIELS